MPLRHYTVPFLARLLPTCFPILLSAPSAPGLGADGREGYMAFFVPSLMGRDDATWGYVASAK